MSITDQSSFVGTTINTLANPRLLPLVQKGRALMDEIFKTHPEWAALYEDTDPFSAPLEDIMELMESAPCDAASIVMYTIYHGRVELAAMTGRPFV